MIPSQRRRLTGQASNSCRHAPATVVLATNDWASKRRLRITGNCSNDRWRRQFPRWIRFAQPGMIRLLPGDRSPDGRSACCPRAGGPAAQTPARHQEGQDTNGAAAAVGPRQANRTRRSNRPAGSSQIGSPRRYRPSSSASPQPICVAGSATLRRHFRQIVPGPAATIGLPAAKGRHRLLRCTPGPASPPSY